MKRLTSHIQSSIRSSTTIITILALLFASVAHTSMAEAPKQGDLLQSKTTSTTLVDGLTQEQRAAKIDAFFGQWNLPLTGQGMEFVQAADAYGLDWRLTAAIAFNESTAGKFECRPTKEGVKKYNPFGWGSCKLMFKSYKDAITKVTQHLAGAHEATDHYYAGKTIPQILDAYNPPSIRHDYKKLVMGTMAKISAMPIPQTQLAVNK
jgi:hypothetical protein